RKAGVSAESEAENYRVPVEPARLDEDFSIDDLRSAVAGSVSGVRELLCEIHQGLRSRRHSDLRHHDAERAAKYSRQLSGHGNDRDRTNRIFARSSGTCAEIRRAQDESFCV